MEISINSFEHPKNLKLMFQLGIINADTDEAEVFLRWGGLIRSMPGSLGDIRKMAANRSPAQRIALRDKICGVTEMPTP